MTRIKVDKKSYFAIKKLANYRFLDAGSVASDGSLLFTNWEVVLSSYLGDAMAFTFVHR